MLMHDVMSSKFAGGRTCRGGSAQARSGARRVRHLVAAELLGMGVQTLRLYEARGLLEPERTEGGTRRYRANDLDRLRRIGDLLDAGLNLAGIGMVMDLQDENTQLRADKEEQQWLTTASIPATRSPTRTSSSSKPRSTRR
jgi:MerR family transcriptional regulator, heat shock protein HspR